MAKKAQKIKKNKRTELLIVNPDAAGIDIASTEYQVCVPEDRDENNNRRFDAFTHDLKLIVTWLKQCRIENCCDGSHRYLLGSTLYNFGRERF